VSDAAVFSLVNLAYLVAAVLFIAAFKHMAHPRTAPRGNRLGALGMLIAIVVTLLDRHILSYEMIAAGMVVGSALGAWMALRIPMIAMPQMVGVLNGFGGGASVLVAGAALIEALGAHRGADPGAQFMVATVASGAIGAVTFWGSAAAADKLQEFLLAGAAVHFRGQQALNLALLIVTLGFGAYLIATPGATWAYWALVAAASVLGLGVVLPIGGADMPVVICLLNSYSGLAGAATGFVLENTMLIIAGALVGASGLILTNIMCKAMNRSMTNVVLGYFDPSEETLSSEEMYRSVKAAGPEELAMVFDGAQRVVIVPGYGMAVSQAQHAVRDLANLLESRGAQVEFGIHPVAGRMPGHMNVLLAEANVPYEKMKEMDEINPTLEQTDVAIVIGANDTVNPLAKSEAKGPIAGMPIIEVDKARTVIVIKRSLSPGFAGVPNPLFAKENTLMYFADGKKAVLDLIAALKEA